MSQNPTTTQEQSRSKWHSTQKQSALNGLKYQLSTEQTYSATKPNQQSLLVNSSRTINLLDCTEELNILKAINTSTSLEEIYQFDDDQLIDSCSPLLENSIEDSIQTIFGHSGVLNDDEETTVTIITTPSLTTQFDSMKTTPTMGLSNLMEIGSLVCQDTTEFAKSESLMTLNDLDGNESGTTDIIYTNTPASEAKVDDPFDLQSIEENNQLQQFNTNNPRTLEATRETIIESNSTTNYPNILIVPQQQQNKPAEEQGTSNNNHNNFFYDLSSDTSNIAGIMYQELEFDEFFAQSPCSQGTAVKLEEIHSGGQDPLSGQIAINNCNNANNRNNNEQNINLDTTDLDMSTEESFAIRCYDNDYCLTATQEQIIDAGISSEDFVDHKAAVIDIKFLVENDYQTGDDEKDEFKLDSDPMMSTNIFIPKAPEMSSIPLKTENDLDLMEIDEVTNLAAIKQLMELAAYAETEAKLEEPMSLYPSASTSPVKKIRHHNLGKLSMPIIAVSVSTAEPTTAEVLDTVINWVEDDSTHATISSIPPASCNSTLSHNDSTTFFTYDDVSQSSPISSPGSRYDYSDISSTAPPTPFSTSSTPKRRGRPPKSQSTQPDPETLKKLSPSDRRYMLQRFKNNEASRQSRRNRKSKQEQQQDEERQLTNYQFKLKQSLCRWEQKEKLLKAMLKQMVVK